MKLQHTMFLPLSILTLMLTATFSISCMLTAKNMPARILEHGETSLAAVILDAGRTSLSVYLYEKADLYFHMGKERKVNLAFSDDWYQRIRTSLNPAEHVHRSGEQVKEIMPWLWLAAQADPHNIMHYVVASFWLAHEAGRPDIARQLLAQARWQNPFNYTIAMEDALICLHLGHADEAASLLDAGLAFWPGKANPEDEEILNDKSRMLLYRALLHEASGNTEAAINNLNEIIMAFPDRKEIRSRIEELKSGREPSLLASGTWSAILKTDIDSRKDHKCDYDDHDED